MPTPSSDPPLDPSSPPSYNFSTCPDEFQHSVRNTQPAQEGMAPALDSMDGRQGQSSADVPPTSSDTQQSSALLDRISTDLSSRASTISPRPLSSATGVPALLPGLGSSVRSRRMDNRLVVDGHSALDISSPAERLASQPEGSDNAADSCDDDIYSSCFVGLDYSNKRFIPINPSSYLRPGAKFHGTQQSERQVYDVQVEIKYVDLRESFLCGYLRIQGLTEDHPTLTTYFEGEIIGTKYSFFTGHEDWGANAKVDLSHWAKFGAFRPYQKQAKKGPVYIPDVAQKETMFMRWKEHFLVPDHRVRTIHGASFEGFYYICFNQVKGEVSGIYFHSKSEKFQQLELKHVPDRGCSAAMEFR